MKVEVRYFSKGGNTKKLADRIASEFEVQALPVSSPLEAKTDVLFLGSSLYAGSPNVEVLDFIKSNAFNIGKIVCFGSSASGKSTYSKLKAFAQGYKVDVADDFFNCPGKFLFMHKGRPNEQDIDAIAEFARKAVR